MKKYSIILICLIGLAGVGRAASPNILYILADDLGYADLSAQGWSELEFNTPNIDSIFHGGVRFKAGFVSNSVCAPSRAGLLTGRSGSRFGFDANIPHAYANSPGSTIGLDPSQSTLADVLKSAGYKTYALGKWHLGDNDALFHPNLRGFDEFYGLIGGSRSYFQLPNYDHLNSIEHNGVWVQEPANLYVTDFLTDQALAYISDQTVNHPEQPWFMYMSYTAPHSPMHAKPEDLARVPLANHFSKASDNAKRQIYGAMVLSMDDNVGRLLNRLNALGIAENTLIVFHSDNGGPLVGQNWSINSPLRGNKGSLWEGGIRVPFAIQWAGTIPAGQVFDHDCPVSSLDLMPTFAAVSGADQNRLIRTDGINLMPLLTNGVATTAPRKLYWRRGSKSNIAMRSGHYKYYRNRSNDDTYLFNHETGSNENDNRVSQEPAMLALLQEEYAAYEATLPDPAWSAWGANIGPLLAVTTYDLPPAQAGDPYHLSLNASSPSGTLSWSIVSGKPDWLSIDPVTGELSGTPTASDTYYNEIELQVSNGSSTSTYTVPLLVPDGTINHPIYLSASGSNDHDGLSPATAWRDFDALTGKTFGSGAQILLRAGDIFPGKLFIDGNRGAVDAPIVIDSYGAGPPPVIDASGHLAGIHLRDTEYIMVRNLEITADGGATVDGSNPKLRYGVLIDVGASGAHSNTIQNLYIHDIFPELGSSHEGATPITYVGTAIAIRGSTGASVSNVLIEDCTIERTGFKAIEVARASYVELLSNTMSDIGGPAIQSGRSSDIVVRGNVVDGSGSFSDPRMHGRGSGIWPWTCERVLIEHNTFMHARGRADSCGMHIDFNCRDVVVQYNLSIDNAGGFIEILGNNYNCTYRYNISINDGSRVSGEIMQGTIPSHQDGHIIFTSGYVGNNQTANGPYNSYIYNNTIYVKESIVGKFRIAETTDGLLIANNIFHIEGPTANVNPGNYTPAMIGRVVWKNNLYPRSGIVPSSFPFYDIAPIYGNPDFTQAGGLLAEDYIPQPSGFEMVEHGTIIENIPGDVIGLNVGLAVSVDFFGNPVPENAAPTIGAYQFTMKPPAFTENPLSRPNVQVGKVYSDTLVGSAIDADPGDVLVYAKVSGPDWLTVAPDGTLSGTPTSNDLGENKFTVSVSDGVFPLVEAGLNFFVYESVVLSAGSSDLFDLNHLFSASGVQYVIIQNSNPDLVSATLNDPEHLLFSCSPEMTGAAQITIRVLSSDHPVESYMIDLLVIPEPDVIMGPVLLNRQNGLYEQTVTVSNRSPTAAANAVTLTVSNLTEGASLYNATGTDAAGNPKILWVGTLDALTSIDFTLQYYTAVRGAAPTGTVTVVLSLEVPRPAVTGRQVALSGELLRSEESLRFLIEFSAVPGRTYYIQYTDSLLNEWTTVYPAIVAPTDRVQWIDLGPPLTESAPTHTPERFYRLIESDE